MARVFVNSVAQCRGTAREPGIGNLAEIWRNEVMSKVPSTKKNGGGIRPVGDKILVKRDEAQTKTDSGIFLPETSKDKPKTGVIQAVGPGSINSDTGERIPLSVKSGDKIIFTSYAGTEIKLDGEELLIMSEDDILAVID
jgi:chaperonin GroES